jgi:hypothetical protein
VPMWSRCGLAPVPLRLEVDAGAFGGFVVCKPLLNKIEWTERTCVVKRGCVFSTILWVIIIVVALLAIGFFARGRRR